MATGRHDGKLSSYTFRFQKASSSDNSYTDEKKNK